MHCHCDEIAKLFATATANDDLKPHLALWEAVGGEANTSTRLVFVTKQTGKEWLLVRNDENKIIGLATDNKWYNEVVPSLSLCKPHVLTSGGGVLLETFLFSDPTVIGDFCAG